MKAKWGGTKQYDQDRPWLEQSNFFLEEEFNL